MKLVQYILGCALLLFFTNNLSGQKISTIDIVRAKNLDLPEVTYFYEQNWLAFRKEALSRGYISDYKLLQSAPDSAGHVYLTLLTEYPDSASYLKAEEHFRPIMTRLSPNGPKYLTHRKIRDSLTYEYSTEGKHQFDHDVTTPAAITPSNPEEITKIKHVLLDYIEGTAEGQPERLRIAFHPDFNLYTVTENDSLLIRNGQQYINGFKSGQKINRPGKILSIDFENNAATAKVEITMPNGRIYTDYFLLLKYLGHWRIVQKSYTWRRG